MSDDERPDTEDTDASDATTAGVAAEAKAPLSATSRARRIGGRPTIPTAPPVPSPANLEKSRHASPPPAPKAKPAKVAKPKTDELANNRLLAWTPAALLGVAALVLVVLIAIAGHGVYYAKDNVSGNARDNTQQTALAAAKSCIATINTYDYRNLSKNETAALACITGAFTAKMKTTYSKTLIPEAPVAKSTQTAQINYAGIKSVSADGKQVQVLLFGQLAVTNVQTASTGAPRYDVFGIVATMNKVGEKWLVAAYVSDTGDTAGK